MSGGATGGHRAAGTPGPTSPRNPRQVRERRQDGPKRVRGGVKLRAREGVIKRTPLSDPFLRRLEELIPTEACTEGHRYAKLGQIVSLDLDDSGIEAKVQGMEPKPQTVRLGLDVFTGQEWERIIDGMAGEAVYLVKLLADEMPEGIDGLLETVGLTLLPDREAPLRLECTCGKGGACEHAAAVGYIVAERLATDPLLIFTIRGMPRERLLERLRQARVLQTRGVAAAHADPMIPESQIAPKSLEHCLEEFWRPVPGSAKGEEAAPPKHVTHALLRRLGPSPLEGKFPLVGLLASIYDCVAERAVAIRDHAEHLDVPTEVEEEGEEEGADEQEG